MGREVVGARGGMGGGGSWDAGRGGGTGKGGDFALFSGARVGASLGIGSAIIFGVGAGEGVCSGGGSANISEKLIAEISPIRPERNFMALLLRHSFILS